MVATALSSRSPSPPSTTGDPEGINLQDIQIIDDDRGMKERSVSNGGSVALANCLEARGFASCRATEPERTYIMRLFRDMKCALKCLKAVATDKQIESWAVLVHESMSPRSRNYHDIQHVFDMSDGVDAIQIFTCFFHDIIYYNVDEGLSPRQAEVLKGVLRIENDACYLTDKNDPYEDPELAMVVSIFGLSFGDQLCACHGCMNEFLSAVVAVRLLKNVLPLPILAEIVVGIEATIPFRKIDENGNSPMDRLYTRLIIANQSFQLGMNHDGIINAIRRAADCSNRNCGSFAMAGLSSFLECTWRLLPEFSPALRQSYLFTVYDYHLAVQRMERFFHKLDPTLVFTSFQGVPQDWELADFNRKTLVNIKLAKKYLRATVASLAIVAAICELTGGNGPMCFFLGDLPSRTSHSDRTGDNLPKLDENELAHDCNVQVYSVLANGRNGENSFDANESPITAFVYGMLGDSGVFKAKAYDKAPISKDRAMSLLTFLPRDVLFLVCKSVAKVAITRTETIEELLIAIDQNEL